MALGVVFLFAGAGSDGSPSTVQTSEPALVLAAAETTAVVAQLGQPLPFAIDVLGADGRGRIQSPGRSCDDGGAGAYWHHDHEARLAPGALTSLPGDLTFLLELHSDVIRRPNSVDLPPAGPPGDPPTAFMPPGQSLAVLGNQRGTIRLGLASGTCAAPTLRFNGRSAAGEGEWTIEGGTGSYEGVAGSGGFAFAADVDPGADNPWSITLDGDLQVNQPALEAKVVNTFWGNHGTDYVTRRVSVTYELTNTGAGDAFGARLVTTNSPTPGVTPLGPHDQPLGDLHAGESIQVTVRYQLGLLQPCALIILGCDFTTGLTVGWTDALDIASQAVAPPMPVSAPDLPPVL